MTLHTCSYHCDRPACIKAQRDELRDKMEQRVAWFVAAEREACAKVCEEWGAWNNVAQDIAAAIRARGEK